MTNKRRQQQTTTSGRTALTRYDPRITNASYGAVSRAEGIADRPYTPYSGERIAGLSENEQLALGRAQTGMDDAKKLTKQGSMGFDKAWQQGYLEPYMENLAGPMVTEANRDFEKQRRSLKGQEAMVGAFGGGRTGLQEGELTSRHLENLRDIKGQAFDRAIGVFSSDQQRKLAAGQGLANMSTAEVRDLMATGNVDRVLQQANLDFDYGQYLEARDWDVTNLMPLLETLQSVPKDISQYETAQQVTEDISRAGVLGQIIGLASTVAGAYFTGGFNLGGQTAQEAGTTAANAGGAFEGYYDIG